MNIKVLNDKNSLPYLVYSEKAIYSLLNMLGSTHAKTKEFQFIGTVTKNDDMYLIDDFFLVPNEKTSGVYCETDDEKYPEWLNENFPTPESRKKIRAQCHSHVDMPTKPSGTDEQQIRDTVNLVKDFYIQLIVNKSLRNTANLYDKEKNIIFEDINQYVLLNSALINLCNYKIENINEIVSINNNVLKIKKGFTVNFSNTLNLQIECEGKYIKFKDNKFEVISPIDSNKLFDELIKKDSNPPYKYNYTPLQPYGYYDGYDEGYIDEYPYNYFKNNLSINKKKKGKKK